MEILYTVAGLREELAKHKGENESVGFVPTMGALHAGHIELVKQSVKENTVSVVSIFVNPTQFNDKNDLLKYPRTLDADCKLLQKAGVDIVFAPSEKEVYPESYIAPSYDFGYLENIMEGKFRPGHFKGVAQIVSRLFDIVNTDRAYFGEKDFQQLAVICELVKQIHSKIQIVACPIVREKDGLAMSSRNTRLNEQQRKEAASISQVLFESKHIHTDYTVAELKSWVSGKINAIPELQIEYFDIVDGATLHSIQDWNETGRPVGCIAVYAGEVRLIDNLAY